MGGRAVGEAGNPTIDADDATILPALPSPFGVEVLLADARNGRDSLSSTRKRWMSPEASGRSGSRLQNADAASGARGVTFSSSQPCRSSAQARSASTPDSGRCQQDGPSGAAEDSAGKPRHCKVKPDAVAEPSARHAGRATAPHQIKTPPVDSRTHRPWGPCPARQPCTTPNHQLSARAMRNRSPTRASQRHPGAADNPPGRCHSAGWASSAGRRVMLKLAPARPDLPGAFRRA